MDFEPGANDIHIRRSIKTDSINSYQSTEAALSLPDGQDSMQGYGVSHFHVYRRDGLSTFAGVFAPVSLSIWSVMLFLRLGYVVGQAGILLSIGMLVLAFLILLCTVLSLCAVSTNGAVEGGGVYYMISRALGPEFGGSIGVLFITANIFSCGLYISGFREALMNNFGPDGYISSGALLGGGHWVNFLYDFMLSVFIFLLAVVGAAMFGRTSVAVLVVLGVSYLSFLISLMVVNHKKIPFSRDNHLCNPENDSLIHNDSVANPCSGNYTGVRHETFLNNLYPNFTTDYSTGKDTDFPLVFAVLFSGVTGIMAGANMSGELKKPDKSIPAGTLTALLTTFLVYFVTVFLLGSSCTGELLKGNYIVAQLINIWPPFIAIGIFSTTIFASLSNLIGASRVLYRVAEDKLFGIFLTPATKTFSRSGNPIPAVLFSWIAVVLVLLIGALNRIAQMTSIFFLLSYAGVNLACLALEATSAPNFRPNFKYFSWHTALIGFVGCIAMMFIINAAFTGAAIIFLLLLLIGLHYYAPVVGWGSISQALIFHQVRKYLLLLDTRKDHVKFWRPQILLLVANPKSCCPLIDFVNDLKKSGLYVLGHVRIGELDDYVLDPVIQDYPYWLSLVDFLRVKAFIELTVAQDVRSGVQQLVRMSGIGAMKPNTVILGFYDNEKQEDTFSKGNMASKVKKYAKLDRGDIEEKFSDLRREDSKEVSPRDYVYMLRDVLHMNKNLCLARNFQSLDKTLVMRIKHTQYIDVWPVDMVHPHGGNVTFDNSSLFTLQLACILNMVSGWKSRTTVRVFLCVTSTMDIKHRELQLRDMLSQLRITAKSVMVPWDHVICHVPVPSGLPSRTGSSVELAPILPDFATGFGETAVGNGTAVTANGSIIPPAVAMVDRSSAEFALMPQQYVQAMNETIKQQINGNTAVVFLNLPPPPNETALHEKYLEYITKLSDGLPPTLLVHGINSVISTGL